MIRLNEGTRFYLWVKGPSDATAMTPRLQVGDWLGPELAAALLQVRRESVVDGMTGHLVGECQNHWGEPEPLRSAPFRVRIPEPGTSNLVTYEQAT